MVTYQHTPDDLLKFSSGGGKLSDLVVWYSLPAGFTCRGADECLSRADRKTGKITDGKNTKFRCYEASLEAIYKSVRNKNWHNRNLVHRYRDDTKALTKLITDSFFINGGSSILRPHIGGDFHWYPYFEAMMNFALAHPKVLVYFYTKSVDFWVRYVDAHGSLPDNVVANASWGGKFDHLIHEHKLKSAMVIGHPEPDIDNWIDHDDTIAMTPAHNWQGPTLPNGAPVFYLLIHGTQPKGSQASKDLSQLRKLGFYGYNKNKKKAGLNTKIFDKYREVIPV